MIKADEVRELFNYDRESGKVLRKRVSVGGCRLPTNRKCKDGYVVIRINHARHFEHRLVWAWHYGAWPNGVIDHINRNKTDNRVENLRDVPNWVNLHNRGANRNNTSGHRGVRFDRKKKTWRVEIRSKHGAYRANAPSYDDAVKTWNTLFDRLNNRIAGN